MNTNSGTTEDVISPGKEREVMVRFRTRFNGSVIFSELLMNKERSFIDRSVSVGDPEPKMFLPPFWPPYPITNEEELQRLSLLKMIYIVDVGLNMKAKSAAEAEAYLQRTFPPRLSIRSEDVYSCQVSIVEDGEVVYNVQQPDPMGIPPTLRTDERGRHPYVKSMMILSLRRYLEKLDA